MATDKAKTKTTSKAAKPSASKASAKPKAAEATVEKAVIEAAPAKEAAAPAVRTAPTKRAHGFRRTLVGRVVSDKMDKTVTVEVVRNALDTMYKKYTRHRARYKAHDPKNEFKTGDRVEIEEHRPISREKRWLVTRLVSRPVQE